MIVLLVPLLCSCSSPVQQKNNPRETEVVEQSSVEAEKSGPLFVYKEQQQRIILSLGGEPTLLPSGYARLVGVVEGERAIACLEVGGRGLVAGLGETIDGYRVTKLEQNKVEMKRVLK